MKMFLLLFALPTKVTTFYSPRTSTIRSLKRFKQSPEQRHTFLTNFVPVSRQQSLELRDSATTRQEEGSSAVEQTFDEEQMDFAMGYLNKHHRDLLVSFAVVFTEIGIMQARKNAFSGGTYTVKDATIVGVNSESITLDVTVKLRREKDSRVETVVLPLDASPTSPMQREYPDQPQIPSQENANPMDHFIRRMNRLCMIAKKPAVTGKLFQLGIQLGGTTLGELKEDMYLNQVPHNRFVRKYFYEMASNATLEAVLLCSQGKISNRMKLIAMFPELNPSMDSYRIGTLLELVRSIAITLAEQNLRVRLCVQPSMGVGIFTGLPKSLSGLSTLLQRMDWQSDIGEENEGMVGDYVNFGSVGKDSVVNAGIDRRGRKIEQDDVFIILCPQSMVGVDTSIMGKLSEMVDAAGDRPVILINPDLTDKISSQGQQNVRGRKERIDFANSFKTVFQFQNVYVSGTSYFPILGAISKLGPTSPWIAYQRRDRINKGGEIYIPIISSEEIPNGETFLAAIDN